MLVHRAVPVLTVRDVAQAVATCRDVLGMEVVMDHGWIATVGSVDGAQVSLMTEDASAPCPPDASLEVSDVQRAHDRAVAEGLEIVHPLTDEPWGVRRFFFRDQAGNVVNVLAHAS